MIDPMLKTQLERDFVSRTPKHPVKLPQFLQADLPAAADWRWGLVAVTDVGSAAISNGSAWVRADGSAL